MKKTVRIGLIQTAVSEDLKANLKKTAEKIEEAAEKGAQIICLQELYRTKYFPQEDKKNASRFAETIPGESTKAFSALAKKRGIVIIAPLFEKGGDGNYYNSAAVIDAGGALLGTYRKIHVPHDPLFYEKSYFTPGDKGYQVYKTRYASISVLICYDQWYPEAARICTLNGAEILFYPTAIGRIKGYSPEEGDWREAWETVQRGHAIANGVHVAAVNRAGEEGELKFWGSSFACGPFGKIIKRAGEGEETVVAELDLQENEAIRDGWGFLRNRRPDTYGPLSEQRQTDPEGTPGPAGKTPRELGYRMPAEWEKHDAIWLAWPHDPITFPDRVEKAEETYARIIAAIQGSEKVNLFVKDGGMRARAETMLKKKKADPGKIDFHVHEYADVWFRDYGPIFLTNGKLAMSHWIFNAWGGKYDTLMGDTKIPSIINKEMKLPCFRPGIVLEGGSIDVNGKGTLLTTEQCLLNRNRNPQLGKKDIERYLKDYLGATNVIWLKEGIVGDDTDGHVDDIARFVNPTTVLCAYEDDPSDENHAILKENYELLMKAKDQGGKSLTVIKLPMPGFVGDGEGRLPASYANFYIGNKAVLVPIFGHENDRRALEIIQKAFPGRKAVGIDCSDLVHGLGTIHCISQQQPSAGE